MGLFSKKQPTKAASPTSKLEHSVDLLAKAVVAHHGYNGGVGSLGGSIDQLVGLVLPDLIEQAWHAGGDEALTSARRKGSDAVERELRENVSLWVRAGTDPADVHGAYEVLMNQLLQPHLRT